MGERLFNYGDLIDFAAAILTKAGLHNEKAIIVARTLVEADLMGHTTHGLQLLKPYIGELEKGSMRKSGENPTDDPEEFYTDPPATVLPSGGLDTGYKGSAFGDFGRSIN